MDQHDHIKCPNTGAVFGRSLANRRLYVSVDGGAITESAQWGSGLVPAVTSGRINVGRDGEYNAKYFDGLVGPVRFYDRMLTADEISYLWNGGTGR